MQAKVRRQKERRGGEGKKGHEFFRDKRNSCLAIRNSKHPRTLFVSLGPRASSPLTAWKLLSSLANVDIKKQIVYIVLVSRERIRD